MSDNTSNPLVSIIVRTKDRPKLLLNALKTIHQQTYRPIEVVLVNDGGCDLDLDEIKSILGDVTLNYIRLEKNTGRAHAGNVGIDNAKGEYIGFLDDDDEFYPEHISSVIPLLTSLDYHIAYTDTEIIYRKYDLNKKALENTEKKVFRSKDFSYEDMLLENYIPIISVMFSRDVFSTVDKFDESLDIYEDWDYLIRCSQHYHFYHIHKATTKYIQWSDAYQVAQTKKYEKLIEKFYTKVIEKHKTRFSPEIIKYYRDQINMLYSKLMDRDAIIERLEQTLHKKDSEIKALEQKLDEIQAQLNLIMSSKGWRLLCKFYKIKDFLLNIQKLK